MKLSLIVATRGDHLAPFFESVRRLVVSSPWELLLVVNSSSPPAAEEIAQHTHGLPLTVLHEPTPGKSRALNRALQIATGDLLVFTDDDVNHETHWLDHLATAAKANPQSTIFGGRIVPLGDVPTWVSRSSNLQALLLCEQDFGAERTFPAGVYPFGPNLAVRRGAVEASGARFPENMGPGTALPVGDEYAFLAQISRPNATDRIYVADAEVQHRVQPRYFTVLGAIERCYRCGFASGRLEAEFGKPHRATGRQRVWQRLRGLRSFRELACVVTRALGFRLGQRKP